MLNEYLEYESYISEPISTRPRVQPKLLTDSFEMKQRKKDRKPEYKLRGLDQVLTIVARGFLFSDEDWIKTQFFQNGLITDDGIAATKEMLNRWCGFQQDSEIDKTGNKIVSSWFQKHPEADGWLKNYLCYQMKLSKAIEEDKSKIQIEEKLKTEWSGYAEKWKKIYNAVVDYQAESITFNNIIAAAIEKGALTERYCAIKKPEGREIKSKEVLYDNLFKKDKKDESVEHKKEEPVEKTKPNMVKMQKMLKNIIAYRIWQEEHPGYQKEVLLRKLRLFGWYGCDDGNGKMRDWCFDLFIWKGKHLMYHIGEGSDYAKFGIDEDFLKEFGFGLIDPEQKEKYEEKYLILKDTGVGDLEIINIQSAKIGQ